MDVEVKDDNDIDRFQLLLTRMLDTYKRKNKSYGDAWKDFGMEGITVRMNDKMRRLVNLYWKMKERERDGESIRDNLLDIAVYAVLGILWMEYYEGKK